jgi:DNA-directed RNA polymerase specialized sigma24 family protein
MEISLSPELTDGELVQQARGGSLAAFELLTGRHERRVYSLAMRMLRQEQDAEDVTQANVKVRLLRARLQLREHLTLALGDPATRLIRSHHHAH